MQFFRSSLSHLALATTLFGLVPAIAPPAADARQTCGTFTINWGGTVRQEDILSCAVEWNSGAGRRDRYYLDIKKAKIYDEFKVFELSFPKEFDGEVNDEKIRVRVDGKEVDLITEETMWDPDSAPLASNAQRTQEAVSTISNAASTSRRPSSDGELVFDASGNLVFVDAATIAAQEAEAAMDDPATMLEEETQEAEMEDSDEPRSRSLFITLAEPLDPESEVEIILDSVKNPSRGGMYLVTAFARSQGAPLPSRLGSWFLDIDF